MVRDVVAPGVRARLRRRQAGRHAAQAARRLAACTPSAGGTGSSSATGIAAPTTGSWRTMARSSSAPRPAPSLGSETLDTKRLLRALRGAPAQTAPPPPPAEGDELEASPPLECTEREIERWNAEWFEYLKREWEYQLAPHTAYPDRPPLPASPLGLLHLRLGHGWPLSLYCDRDALEGRRVMEMGCGCGNLGKLLARYVESISAPTTAPLALKIARPGLPRQLRLRPSRRPRWPRPLLRHDRHRHRPLLLDPSELQARRLEPGVPGALPQTRRPALRRLLLARPQAPSRRSSSRPTIRSPNLPLGHLPLQRRGRPPADRGPPVRHPARGDLAGDAAPLRGPGAAARSLNQGKLNPGK